ncbi:hypothetical protein R3P38DRAFT_3210743 [Favolaschia claudopus]|uniref:Uncharacterized protein n=1 Tax=Favolaschia claudopus TaxID=2862362 RepID=A0AAW0AHW9_9AGAR
MPGFTTSRLSAFPRRSARLGADNAPTGIGELKLYVLLYESPFYPSSLLHSVACRHRREAGLAAALTPNLKTPCRPVGRPVLHLVAYAAEQYSCRRPRRISRHRLGSSDEALSASPSFLPVFVTIRRSDVKLACKIQDSSLRALSTTKIQESFVYELKERSALFCASVSSTSPAILPPEKSSLSANLLAALVSTRNDVLLVPRQRRLVPPPALQRVQVHPGAHDASLLWIARLDLIQASLRYGDARCLRSSGGLDFLGASSEVGKELYVNATHFKRELSLLRRLRWFRGRQLHSFRRAGVLTPKDPRLSGRPLTTRTPTA